MNIGNLSAQSLERIRPYIEKVAGRDIPPPRIGEPLSEEHIALRVIRREVEGQRPTATHAELAQFSSSLADFRQQRIANGEGITGMFSMVNGVGDRLGGRQNMLNLSHQANLDIVARLMEQINSLGGSGGMSVSGNNVDESV